METSSTDSNSSQFPLVDMILFYFVTCYIRSLDMILFYFVACYIRSFSSIYSSFPQHQHEHGCSKASASSQNFEFSKKEIASTEKKEDGGRIYRKDVEKLMGNLGLFCSQESEELNESFGSDELSRLFEEEPSLEEVKQAFDVFDEKRDGFIDAEELQRVLLILGLKEGSKLENCNEMINTFDEDGDGRIDFQEFVKLMENSFC